MSEANAPSKESALTITTSRLFPSWLASRNASIAFTTYQAGKFFLIGVKPDGALSVFERTIERPMALCAAGGDLYLSSLFQLWRFKAIAGAGDYQGHDRLYSPRQSWVTGDIDIHDIKVDRTGRVFFVNTLFSCIAAASASDSFDPVWRPKFISKLAAEDRCHLNGMAMKDGAPAFATAVGRCDVADGWRDHRRGGGVLIDIASDEVAASGLSMPHAPRVKDGRVYLVNAGTGEFGAVDLASGKFQPIAFCPGFLRGLDFVDDFAIITMSLPRGNRTFEGLPLQETLEKTGAAPRCGVAVIDLKTGDLAHWLRLEGVVTELFDAVVLDGAKRPAAIGFRSDEIRRVLSIGPAQPLDGEP